MNGAARPVDWAGEVLVGAVLTIVQHIPAEQQMETAATLVQLLEERLKARGVLGGDAGSAEHVVPAILGTSTSAQ